MPLDPAKIKKAVLEEASRVQRLVLLPKEDDKGGTAQTRSRRRIDQLGRLHRLGVLDERQVLAARRLDDIYCAVVRGLQPGIGAYDPSAAIGRGVGSVKQPFEKLTPTQYLVWKLVYKPWVAKTSKMWWVVGGSKTRIMVSHKSVMEVTRNLVMERWTIDELIGGYNRAALDRLYQAITDSLNIFDDLWERNAKELDGL